MTRSGSLLSRWFGPSALAVLDQALWSGGNFLVSLVLARELGADQFGVFSAAFVSLMLFGALHTALVSEPMLVLGSKKPNPMRRQYIASVMRYGVIVTLPPAALTVAVGVGLWLFTARESGPLLVAFGLSFPLVMVGWVARRACYVERKYVLAAGSTLVHAVLAVGALIALQASGTLIAASGIVPYAVASLSVGVIVATRMRLLSVSAPAGALREIHFEHWRFGRWSTGAAALSWIASQSYYVFIPLVLSHGANGAVRALGLLILPAMQSFSALGLILIPRLSRAAQDGTFTSSLRRVMVVFTAAGWIYGVLLVVFAGPIVEVVVGADYADYVHIARAYGLLPAIAGTTTVVGSALRAGNWPSDILLGALAAASTTAVVGVYATIHYGAIGAVIGMVIAALASAAIQVIRLRMRVANRGPRPDMLGVAGKR